MTRRLSLLLIPLLFAYLLAPRLPAPRGAPVIPSEPWGVVETDPALLGAPYVRGGLDPSNGIQESLPSGATSISYPRPSGAPQPSGGIGDPASYQKPTPKPRGGGIGGWASWYDDGPGLYVALPGGDFRGHNAVICGGSPFTCLTVPVRTSCICTGPPRKVADLSPDLFRQFARLSAGIVRVTVTIVGRTG